MPYAVHIFYVVQAGRWKQSHRAEISVYGVQMLEITIVGIYWETKLM